MCGICGIYNFGNSNFNIEENLLSSMCGTMAHRGPDDQGTYVDPKNRIGLGHRRLSIIDLTSAGHQPMCNEDQSIWVTFNGEIYNQKKLKAYLEEKGHKFASHSDTECIIHLYEEKGPDCVHDFEGMFAFCIWDTKKEIIFLARDRIGVKPLYYTIKNGLFIFASEIKSILEVPFIERKVNRQALYQYLTFTTVPPPLTMFEGIYKMPGGYRMICDKHGNITQDQYWDALVPSVAPQPEEYYVEQIRALFSQAIEKRMMSDVPFGVFLSGGVDSSLNVALMARLMDRPVDTFTVGFDNIYGRMEFQYAHDMARLFKTNHHERLITNKDLMDFLPILIHHQDEPIADPMCVALHYVSKLAKDNGTTVIQVGEGSDEIFFGYGSYAEMLRLYKTYWKRFTPLPHNIKKPFFSLMRPWLDAERLDVVHRSLHNKELFYSGTYVFGEYEKTRLLTDEAQKLSQGWDSFDTIKPFYDKFSAQKPEAEFMEKMIYMDLKIRLPELLLMRVDKMSMISAIEARVPFLDHKLVEFAMTIPNELKLKGGAGKYILKKAAEGILPNETIYRKKMGFCGTYKDALSPELMQYAEKILLTSEFSRKYFRAEHIKKLFFEHQNPKVDRSMKIWNLFNLVLWYNHWIAGDDSI